MSKGKKGKSCNEVEDVTFYVNLAKEAWEEERNERGKSQMMSERKNIDYKDKIQRFHRTRSSRSYVAKRRETGDGNNDFHTHQRGDERKMECGFTYETKEKINQARVTQTTHPPTKIEKTWGIGSQDKDADEARIKKRDMVDSGTDEWNIAEAEHILCSEKENKQEVAEAQKSPPFFASQLHLWVVSVSKTRILY